VPLSPSEGMAFQIRIGILIRYWFLPKRNSRENADAYGNPNPVATPLP
jgi:hypothetical protein